MSKELAEWIANLSFSSPGFATRVVFAHNFHPAAAARNRFCLQGKDHEADWVCMLDNDMAPPINLLDTLKDVPEDAGIVVPAFYLWDQDKGKAVLCWGVSEDKRDANGIGRFDPGFHELNKCGTGVIFIRPSALRKIEYPYFSYLYTPNGDLEGTEDIQFCLRALKAGVKIYGNASVNVGHWHSVNISTLAELLHQKNIDNAKATGVDSIHQDSARSADRTAETCSVEAT